MRRSGCERWSACECVRGKRELVYRLRLQTREIGWNTSEHREPKCLGSRHLAPRLPKLIESSIGPLDFARERFSLLGLQCAPMPSYKQRKAKVRFELRNRATDMRLADAKCFRGSRHPAVTHNGTKQVDIGRVGDDRPFRMVGPRRTPD